jgi:hypothetical protein
VRFAYEALDGVSSPAARDRVLLDIAASFIELGVVSAARDALLVIAATAEEQYLRWAATINLVDLSTREGCEPLFEQYRRQLADAPLPPALEAAYYLSVGRGYAAFSRIEPARLSLAKAMDLAESHKLHQVAHEAELELEQLDKKSQPVPTPSGYQPTERVEEIVAALRDMRELAGVPG